MSGVEYKFPKGFHWGASTASYQVEGGIENNDWAEASREGRVPVCGLACDHYRRYEEDFDLAKSLGHNAHRFSVEWARIEPEEGKFDEEAIEHYKKVLDSLKERKIEPYLTLWHFTLPLWFVSKGGFENPESARYFARYCAYLASKLGDRCHRFATMNEPNVFASNGWLQGSWPPFKRFVLTGLVKITNSDNKESDVSNNGWRSLWLHYKVLNNLISAHNEAYKAIKSVAPKSEVSLVKHVIVFDSNRNPFNKLKALVSHYIWTDYFMRRVYKSCDSIGLNYYFYTRFGDRTEWRKTDMGWNFAPQYIYQALMSLNKYGLPLYVAEGGLADASDEGRREYIRGQVKATWRAINEGVDVKAHLYWSLLDNYEWAYGFDKRFGLIEIDYDTKERKVRRSAYEYKEICINNGLSAK